MLTELKDYKQIVDNKLAEFFNDRIQDSAELSPFSEEIMQIIRDYTLRGGKRVRAALLFYGAKAISDLNDEDLQKASICMELVQSYLLIHDDIMDQDALRRNGPTVHTSYTKLARKYKRFDKEHFGNTMAIAAGDICSCLANLLLIQTNFDPKNKLSATKKLNQMMHKVIHGQVIDVLNDHSSTEDDILFGYALKTATYTVQGPLEIGAMLAGATNEQLQSIADYSIPLGKAFQIQDDILDLFADEKKLGKPVGSDIREGKPTLLITKTLQNADPKDKKFIQSMLGNHKISEKQLEKVRCIIRRSGALSYCKNLAKSYIYDAKQALTRANFQQKGKLFMQNIADYMLDRDY